MSERKTYAIAFYQSSNCSEFLYALSNKDEYNKAKYFLDRVLKLHDVPSDVQSQSDVPSSDFYGIDEQQYLSFRQFMRDEKKQTSGRE